MNAHRFFSRIRRITIAAMLAPLLVAANAAAQDDDRPMRRMIIPDHKPVIVYPIDRGFVIHDPHNFGVTGEVVSYDVYFAEGSRSPDYMCRYQPNRVHIGEQLHWLDEEEHKVFGDGKLDNGKLYTVMIDKYEQTTKEPHNKNCLYYTIKIRPDADGKVGLIVKHLDSRVVKPSHTLGGGWIQLKWRRPKSVTGYSVYHAEGTIRGGNTARKMCDQKPNREDIGADATQYTVTGLQSGVTYSFMVAAHFNSRADRVNCAIVYHVGAHLSERADNAPRNLNPNNQHVSHLAGDGMVRVEWQRPRVAVSGYTIYRVRGDGSPSQLCGARANPIHIDRNAQRHDITGLTNGQTYTFLLKVNDSSGKLGPCPYLYHFTATANKPRIYTITNRNPSGRGVFLQQGDRWKIHLGWGYDRQAVAWHLYHKPGKHTDAKKFCAERPNPIIIRNGWNSYDFLDLDRDREYTFMVETEYASRSLPTELRTHCNYALFGHQTTTQWAP